MASAKAFSQKKLTNKAMVSATKICCKSIWAIVLFATYPSTLLCLHICERLVVFKRVLGKTPSPVFKNMSSDTRKNEYAYIVHCMMIMLTNSNVDGLFTVMNRSRKKEFWGRVHRLFLSKTPNIPLSFKMSPILFVNTLSTSLAWWIGSASIINTLYIVSTRIVFVESVIMRNTYLTIAIGGVIDILSRQVAVKNDTVINYNDRPDNQSVRITRSHSDIGPESSATSVQRIGGSDSS